MIDAMPGARAAITPTYLGHMAARLCQYPRSIAIECTDPIRGVLTKGPFFPVPQIHDIAKWCDPKVEDMSKTAEKQANREKQFREREEFDRTKPQKRVGGTHRANLFVGKDIPRYAEMLERANTADAKDFVCEPGGIWVPRDWWDQAPRSASWKGLTTEDLQRIYAREDRG